MLLRRSPLGSPLRLPQPSLWRSPIRIEAEWSREEEGADGVVVGEVEGISAVGEGVEGGGVEDVVDAEGGEFADVGVADASAFFDEAVAHVAAEEVVGVGERSVVEVAAENDGVGRGIGVGFEDGGLAGAAFVGGDEALEDSVDAVRNVVAGAVGELAIDASLFVAEAEGFEVDAVDADGVGGEDDVGVDAGCAAAGGKVYCASAGEGPPGEDGDVAVDAAVGVGGAGKVST